jgi:hypothetical protein
MPNPATLPKDVFVRQRQVANLDADPRLLLELAIERRGRGLAKLNMPAWKVEVRVLKILAKKNASVADAQAASDDFDLEGVVTFGHGKLRCACSGARCLLPWSRRSDN